MKKLLGFCWILFFLQSEAAEKWLLKEIASGFSQITDLAFDPGDADRLVVIEKEGTVKAVSL
jgi:hypothetical protein